MTLRLSVVSEHGIRLGAHSTKVFGVHGGSIGRGTDNEWILPDPERYLSGKHARVDFRAGSYVLFDTSSNGTFVNGSQVPLGRHHEYVLKDGDYVRLGEYELVVSIDEGNDFPPEAGTTARKATADDLGADLDLSQLLEPSDRLDVDSGVRPRNSYGQAIGPAREAAPAPPPAPAPLPLPIPDDSATPWHMMTRPLKIAVAALEPTPRGPNLSLYEGDVDPGLVAFCRGAGVDPRSITGDARGAAMQLAGQLFRESILGLMDLNQTRHEFRNRFRIPSPADDGPESPLNFSHGVDEALVGLLNTVSTRAGAVDALRDNFRQLKAQHTATLAAMRSAFEEFLERVDPKDLEERFDRATKRGVFGTQNKGKYWDLYAEMFAGLTQRPPDGFPHLFTESFAKAYEAKLRTLIPPRRSTFGADRSEAIEPASKAVGD